MLPHDPLPSLALEVAVDDGLGHRSHMQLGKLPSYRRSTLVSGWGEVEVRQGGKGCTQGNATSAP